MCVDMTVCICQNPSNLSFYHRVGVTEVTKDHKTVSSEYSGCYHPNQTNRDFLQETLNKVWPVVKKKRGGVVRPLGSRLR